MWSFSRVGNPESSGLPKDIAQGREGWLLAEEVITNDGSSADQSSSVIDFLPYGKDFIISAENSATLSATAPVDIDYCETKDGTFTDLATSGIVVPVTTVKQRDYIDVSAKSLQVPYLKLRLDKAATLSAATSKTVTLQVLVPPADGVVY